MRSLPLPKDENEHVYNAGDVFKICVSRVRASAKRNRLLSACTLVETEADDYDAKARKMDLWKKKKHTKVGAVSCGDMVSVYSDRMVKKSGKGRRIYDQIRLASEHGRCPLCGIGAVTSLDHYLPKAHFPVFAVAPNNLIPVCSLCQMNKADYYAKHKEGQLLHPYFDRVYEETWLIAEVVECAPIVFRYSAAPPTHWDASTKARVKEHVTRLRLDSLFAQNAGSRLAEIRHRLKCLYDKGGTGRAVREHLEEELKSIEADCKNSWTAAMYRAAAASSWFCDGGFLEA